MFVNDPPDDVGELQIACARVRFLHESSIAADLRRPSFHIGIRAVGKADERRQ